MSGSATDTDSRLTLAEFAALPDDGWRLELSRGRVVREPQPETRHGCLAAELLYRIDSFVRERGLGRTVTHAGFLLTVDPPTVRGPDVAFVAATGSVAERPRRGWWRGAPDLVVEVLSPSNLASEMQEKVLDYLAAGARLIWLIDPEHRAATVFRSKNDIRLLREDDVLEGHDVLPDFRLPLAELFGSVQDVVA